MISFKKLKRVHMIGIKGTGMSSLALALVSLGVKVTGSDAPESFLLLESHLFAKAGILIADRFDAKNIPKGATAIIASSSHRSKNVEISEARKRKIPILPYADAIGLLSEHFKTIAVCGSHGKTTTTNLLGHILKTLTIAGPTSPQVLEEFGVGKTLILESDEYQNKLKKISPHGVILTNIDWDHPDYFKTKRQYENVFFDFVKRIPADGFLIYCSDDLKVKTKAKTISYGFEPGADVVVRAIANPIAGSPFSINGAIFRIPLLGRHNVLNAAAAVLAARELGIADTDIQSRLMTFRGSPRRLEQVRLDPLIFDDYGHHPTEIRSTLQALRSAYPDRTIWTVFHPHTFTRTKQFLKEFGAAFADSDHTIVLDIFESRETHALPRLRRVNSRDVVSEIQKHKGKAQYAATFEGAAKLLKGKLNEKTLLLTIGAGDVWKLHRLL